MKHGSLDKAAQADSYSMEKLAAVNSKASYRIGVVNGL